MPRSHHSLSSDPESGLYTCKTPSPRSSASQAPPNPRHNPNEPPPRINFNQHIPPAPRHTGSSGFTKGLANIFGGGGGARPAHQRGRSEGRQFELGRAPDQAPNVRERVKKWQQNVVVEVEAEAPEIVSTPPSVVGVQPPVVERRERARSRRRQSGPPLGLRDLVDDGIEVGKMGLDPPPKMPAVVGKEDWDSASEQEKDERRRRAMSQDRERRMRRKRNPTRHSVGNIVLPAAVVNAPPVEGRRGAKTDDEGIRVRALDDMDDGIRVMPMRVKRSASKRKKRAKEEEAGLEVNGDVVNEPFDAPSAAKKEPPAAEPDTDTKSVKSTKTFDDDGIRIYAAPSPVAATPLPVTRATRLHGTGGRMNSVRQSARSVRSRREEFEAQWKKERAADADFKARVRKQEQEEKRTASSFTTPTRAGDIEHEHANKKAENTATDADSIRSRHTIDFNDGIRITPIRTTKTRKKKSDEEIRLQRQRSKSLHQPPPTESAPARPRPSSPLPIDVVNLERRSTPYASTTKNILDPINTSATLHEVESAPATPTGRRDFLNSPGTSALSVKDRAKLLDKGQGNFEFDEFAEYNTSDIIVDDLSTTMGSRSRAAPAWRSTTGVSTAMDPPSAPWKREEAALSDASAGSGKDSARRQKRRELRMALKEAEEARKRDVDLAARRKRERDRKREQEREQEAAAAAAAAGTSKPPISVEPNPTPAQAPVFSSSKSAENLPTSRPPLPQNPTKTSTTATIATERPKSVAASIDSKKSSEFSDVLSSKSSASGGTTPRPKSTPTTPGAARTRREKQRRESSSLAPKIASATTTFLKFCKEELKGSSERKLIPVVADTTDDDGGKATEKERERGGSLKGSRVRKRGSKMGFEEKVAGWQATVESADEEEEGDLTDSESTTESDTEEGSQDEDGSEGSASEKKEKTDTLAIPALAPPRSRSVSMASDIPSEISEGVNAELVAVRARLKPVQRKPTRRRVSRSISTRINPNPIALAATESKKKEKEKDRTPSRPASKEKLKKPSSKNELKSGAVSEPDIPPRPASSSSKESVKRKHQHQRKSSSSAPIVQLEDVEMIPAEPTPRSPKSPEARPSSPQEAKPKRRIRSTTAPPRPRSLHSRASDGSLTPTSSLVGSNIDDHNPITATEAEPETDAPAPVRTPTEASIKPLRFKKRVGETKSERAERRRSQRRALAADEDGEEGETTAVPMTDADRDTGKEMDVEDWYNPVGGSLKRKFTKHEDLISILSQPRSQRTSRSRRTSSRRSSRQQLPLQETSSSHHSKPTKPTSRRQKGRKKVDTLKISDLLDELAHDELRYLRELAALVQDVVPVLFQTVLKEADEDLMATTSLKRTGSTSSARTTNSANSAGSTRSRASGTSFNMNPTRPIVDMGITLERLKALHERMPKRDVEGLMKWAEEARRVYEEYLSVWRMGFADVVVEMRRNEEDEEGWGMVDEGRRKRRKELEVLHGGGEGKWRGDMRSWEMPPSPEKVELLRREEESRWEKVDVAFLLKRPLVRIKALAKLFKRINYMRSSPTADSLSTGYHILVNLARRKISDEKGRLEDEAAASVDTTQVLDLHTLTPLSSISLDPSRRVKARDQFLMRLYHSSGQIVERSVELILRDPPQGRRNMGMLQEVLIVELGMEGGKWLLFPPVMLDKISARTGDAAGEIVVMVRGPDKEGGEWRQVMALGSATAEGFEWVQMLGLMPEPPEGPYIKDHPHPFISSDQDHHLPQQDIFTPHELETVIEESVVSSAVQKPRLIPQPAPIVMEEEYEPLPPGFTLAAFLPDNAYSFIGGLFRIPDIDMDAFNASTKPLEPELLRSPSLHTLASPTSSSSGLKRSARAKRPSRKSSIEDNFIGAGAGAGGNLRLAPTYDATTNQNISKSLSRQRSIHLDEDHRPVASKQPQPSLKLEMDNIPTLAPLNIVKQKSAPTSPTGSESGSESGGSGSGSGSPPPVPPHRVPTNKRTPPPVVVVSPRLGYGRRRTSSPLKHEYAPSDPSVSGDETEVPVVRVEVDSTSEQDEEEATISEEEEETESDSSGSSTDSDESDGSLCSEEEDDGGSILYPGGGGVGMGSGLGVPKTVSRQPSRVISIHRQHPLRHSSSAGTIEHVKSDLGRESDSDSDTATVLADKQPPAPQQQRPTATAAPVQQKQPAVNIATFRCLIMKWSLNHWETFTSSECTITITPGRLEAHTLSPQSSPTSSPPSSPKSHLLFHLDLTLNGTPISRGTAVDISIRTPPTLPPFHGANIMLRSRSPGDCERLYLAIKQNTVFPSTYPTSSATTSTHSLPPSEMASTTTGLTTVSGGTGLASSIRRGFSFSRRTYRAGGSTIDGGSIAPASEATSSGSFSSAFSRFRRKKIFGSSTGSGADGSSPSVSSAAGGEGGTVAVDLLSLPGMEGCVRLMQPLKMKLFKRQNEKVWRIVGSGRVNVLRDANAASIEEKRLVVTNKKGDKILLDVKLREEAFERVARTGVAVNCLRGEGEEGTGKVAAWGGVGARNEVWLMQFGTEAEAAWAFSICGKHRY